MEQLSGSDDGTQTLRCDDDFIDSDKDNVEGAALVLGGENTTAEATMRSKIRGLQVLRAQVVAEIDDDIKSLQKALDIIGATSE